jgi:hypothetical protein
VLAIGILIGIILQKCMKIPEFMESRNTSMGERGRLSATVARAYPTPTKVMEKREKNHPFWPRIDKGPPEEISFVLVIMDNQLFYLSKKHFDNAGYYSMDNKMTIKKPKNNLFMQSIKYRSGTKKLIFKNTIDSARVNEVALNMKNEKLIIKPKSVTMLPQVRYIGVANPKPS